MKETIDCEVIVSRVVSLIQSNLNTKLGSIDTQKNDGITLAPFTAPSGGNNGAYSILTSDAEVMNFNPFLYVGALLPQGMALGPYSEMVIDIDLVVVYLIEGGDINMWKRMLRYQRALKEIVQENWEDFNIPGKLMIESLEPRPLEDLGPKPYMGVGVRLKTTLA